MDKELLVKSGQALLKAMESAKIKTKLAMWVHNTDMDFWKFWLVTDIKDKREFYRKISRIISENRGELGGIDASDTEYVTEKHPAVDVMRNFIRIEGISDVYFSGNTYNGYYMPEGIVLHSSL